MIKMYDARNGVPKEALLPIYDSGHEFRETKFNIAELEAPCVITRNAIRDGLVDLAELQADPLWERDWITDNWVKQKPEFYATRALARELLPTQQAAAEIAFCLALLELESALPIQKDGERGPSTAKGTKYVVLTSHDEGSAVIHRTAAEAIREWQRRALMYVAGYSRHTLLWRERPEIRGVIQDGDSEPAWGIYSRLALE